MWNRNRNIISPDFLVYLCNTITMIRLSSIYRHILTMMSEKVCTNSEAYFAIGCVNITAINTRCTGMICDFPSSAETASQLPGQHDPPAQAAASCTKAPASSRPAQEERYAPCLSASLFQVYVLIIVWERYLLCILHGVIYTYMEF